MGSSNNAAGQNQAAQAEVQQNTQAAQSALANFLKQNPSILSQAGAPAPPQQLGGVQGGGSFGGPKPPMAGAPQMRAPLGMPSGPPVGQTPGMAPGGGGPPKPPGAGAPPLPPGLLALLRPQ